MICRVTLGVQKASLKLHDCFHKSVGFNAKQKQANNVAENNKNTIHVYDRTE